MSKVKLKELDIEPRFIHFQLFCVYTMYYLK